MGETFMVDIACKTAVWETDPTAPGAMAKAAKTVRVDRLVARRCGSEACEATIREATQGPRRARIRVAQVWVWDREEPAARARLLVVRQDEDGTYKYSLSNAPADTSWERLAYMQAQRFWIERCFQDAKSELGMAQYEVRGWNGWHHHMALVCLALLFLLHERCEAVRLPVLGE